MCEGFLLRHGNAKYQYFADNGILRKGRAPTPFPELVQTGGFTIQGWLTTDWESKNAF
jgi:hypothetical protein